VDEIEIRPLARPFSAVVELPGSKSITNRALLLAAMADGPSVIENALFSDDTTHMMDALGRLGFSVEADAGSKRVTVEGLGGTIPASDAELFVGGSGTAMRFLTGFLTLGRGRFRLDGNQRMRERPIGPLLEAMGRLGASVMSERANGCPPVVVEAGRGGFAGGATSIDARVSSQFVSALLMPAPLWPNGLRLTVSGEAARPFIDMTLRMMEAWGVRSSAEGETIVIAGRQRYRAQRYAVEPDASAASYFAAAAAILGSTVRIPGLLASSVQGDTRFLSVLERMGARVEWGPDGVEVTGTGALSGVDVEMNAMPDMVATLAAIAPFASSPTRVRKVGFIRHHESDRLSAIATELKRLGAQVTEFDDGIEIAPSALRSAAIETYDDHRIAMAFAVVGLKVPGVRIRNPGCVAKTFPDFFDKLAALARA
jgi:3-phosphoshikimate 1-carboxyvinyltransferase